MGSSLVLERFTVNCSVCGYLTGHTTLAKALMKATSAQRGHSLRGEVVTVFDVMAHRGRPELYNADGEVLGRRTDDRE